MLSTVSIIINNYNYGKYVLQAIESALAQDYPQLEIIVVDDGSTDDSLSRIRVFSDRAKIICKTNGGQASAINSGFLECTGELIVFLDADDKLAPNAARTVAERFEREDDLVHVMWQMGVVSEEGALSENLVPCSPPEYRNLRQLTIEHGPFGYRTSPMSGNAWHRRFLNKVMPIPEQPFAHGADSCLHTLAPLYGNAGLVDEQISVYRKHGSNYMTSRSQFDMWRVLKERFDPLSEVLSAHLRRQGIEPKFYSFMETWTRQLIALDSALKHIPEHATVILVDDDKLGTGNTIEGRKRRYIMENKRRYFGQPHSSVEAISYLEQLREEGAEFCLITWDARWWLHYYTDFAEHLSRHYHLAYRCEDIVLYRLHRRLASLSA